MVVRIEQSRSFADIKSVRTSSTVDSSVSVGNTSTSVLAENTSRIMAILVNDSDEDIYISLGGTAALNSGIRLNAYGGSLCLDDFTGAITAISTSGSKTLTVTEY